MKIAVIGTGNVGGTLARAFRKAGHTVVLGVRDPNAGFKGQEWAEADQFAVTTIPDAVAKSEVIVLSTPSQVAHDVASQLGDVRDKIIIDTMNAVFMKPAHYTNTADAILDNCNGNDVVKCFNTTGFENMANPTYHGEGIDMFIAGSSARGKEVATQLAKDIGFGQVYDFGGNDKFFLIEQFAYSWINLAIMQKQGRDIAFKVIRRS